MSFRVPGIDGQGEGISNSCLPLRWEVVVSTAHDHLNGCAGYLGRLFSKLEAYTSITSLACHIAITKKGTCQEKR